MTEGWIEGGCHCGLIAFRARGRPDKVVVCNCTICAMKGYLHWIVPQADFVLERGQDRLATYRFNTMQARHHFCPICGVAPFYIARSDPDKIDINARCLRGLDLASLAIETFDGQDWEAAHERYRDPRP